MTETTLMALKGKEQEEQKRLYDASHVTQSGEDYLKTILMLQKKKGMVRSVDLARHMGFSKPSICHAVKVLKQGGFLTMDGDGYLHLTDEGREVAESIYEKHQFFTDSLIEMGVDPKQAEADACQIEHVISEESFQKLKEAKGR
ncbi:MAG: metal-dependent transcriptional regulator [Eubacteriales bacterium]|nr:metal-dependent transcriptional regulator [Eubacteriales bacterium]